MSLYPYETDHSLDGKTALTKGTNVRLRSDSNTTSAVVATIAASGSKAGKLTGRYTVDGTYRWYELENTSVGKNGWIRSDLVTITGTATSTATSSTANASGSSDAEAQRLLDEIVAQDKETMNNLNNAAAMIEQLKAKGVSTTASASKLTSIFTRLQERQEALKKSTWGKVKDSISSAWGSVKKFFGMNGLGNQLGILPIVVVGVVALVAGAGATALVTLKPWKNQSTIDLKESKELKTLLDAADPVVATKIREDLKSQVVDAYTIGERQGSFSSIWNIGKYVAAGVLALWLVPKAMEMMNRRS